MTEPKHISSTAELEKLFADTTYVAVDFYATWCPPCKAIAPVYANFQKQYGIENILEFVKVDVDVARDIAQTYQVSAMPTFMFFKDGKQVAVNGQSLIRGADAQSLKKAAEKLGGLAKKKQDSAL